MDGTMTNTFRFPLIALLTIAVSAVGPVAALAQPHHHRHHHVVQTDNSRPAKATKATRHGGRRHHHAVPAKPTKRTRRGHHVVAAHVAIHRHAQLCQQVMVHQHWVSHCR
jgi:ribosomal protein S7